VVAVPENMRNVVPFSRSKGPHTRRVRHIAQMMRPDPRFTYTVLCAEAGTDILDLSGLQLRFLEIGLESAEAATAASPGPKKPRRASRQVHVPQEDRHES
jgi:hypothetical protein